MTFKIRWRDFYPVTLFVLCLMCRTLVGTTQPKPTVPLPNIWAQLRVVQSISKTCSREQAAWKSERSCPKEQETWPKPAELRYASGSQSDFHLVRDN